MEVKDVNWRSLWRELTSNGWKARPPRVIEQEHRYVPPGENARGKEGEVYFRGSTAVKRRHRHSLNRMGPDDDPDAYEVFDSGDDPDADDFDKQREADDARLIVVDGSVTESDSEDDPIGGNGASETRFNEGFLRALGGSTALESGVLNSDALRDLVLSGHEAPVSVDAHRILERPYVFWSMRW